MPGTMYQIVSCVKAPSGEGILTTIKTGHITAQVLRRYDGTYQHLDNEGYVIDLSEGIAVQREIVVAEFLAQHGLTS